MSIPMRISGREVWRDFVTDGIPSSGPNNPHKRDIRVWTKWVEDIVAAALSGGGLLYATLSSLDADLNHAPNSSAWVVDDNVVENNGIYMKLGAAGAGSWQRMTDLPFSFIFASNTGSGTPAAIQATTDVPVSASALVLLQIAEDYSGDAATISFNSAAPLTIKTNSGDDVQNLAGGSVVYGVISGETFRLANDEAIASLIYEARDAAMAEADRSQNEADRSEAARDIAAGYASDAISGGMDPGLSTVMGMGAITIPAGINHFHVAGYYAAGDGGGALYVKVDDEPIHAGKFQTADGAWWRLAERRRTPEMFGAAGTGLVSDVSALQNALNSFGILGGVIYADNDYLIDADITIPNNVELRLPISVVGFGQVSQQLFKRTGRLRILSTATVKLRAGSVISGGLAIRAGMAGPEVNSASYAGTASTADGHYCRVAGMLIVGFSRPFTSTGFNGVRFEGNRFDCLNGPRVVNDSDRPVFRGNTGHPYGTIEAAGRIETFDTTNWAYRPGVGYEFDGCAWPVSSGNWAYGYNISARFKDCSNPTCEEFSCEGHYTNVDPYVLSSAGVLIEGSTSGGKFSDLNAAHFFNPVMQQDGAADAFNIFSSLHIRDFKANGIAFVTGGGRVDGYHIKGGSANGVTDQNPVGVSANGIRGVATSAPIFVGDGQIDGVGVGIRSAGGNLVVKGKPSIINTATLFNMEAPRYTIASAASIMIPPHIEDVFITGTTAITNIAPSYHGHRVKLTFESTASITKGGTFRMPSSLAGAAGQTIEFFCEGPAGGERWREIARSLNS